MRAIRSALVLSLAAASAAGQAQAIYRCGDSYSQQPCAGGRAIEAGPPPTATERRQAAASTQRDASLADRMEQDRMQQEAQPAQLYVPPPRLDAAAEPHKWPEKKATRKLDVFTASAPPSKLPKDDKTKKKGKAGKTAATPDKPVPQGSGGGAGTLAVRR